MNPEAEKELKKWKSKFPFYRRLMYFIIGYPPKPFSLSEGVWKRWASRFDSPEFDWTKHSGTH
jgi:hypothetical protein